MLLAIDIGNTNTVFAVFDEDRQVCDWRCKTDIGRTADEYAVWLESLFAQSELGFDQIGDIILSSVVPDMNVDIFKMAQKYFHVEVKIVHAGLPALDLEIALDKPAELGADRIVNSIAALEKYGAPSIILDFGTATTFDVLDEKGVYIGGVIAPGVNLSMQALYEAAAQLPKINIEKPEQIVGRSTVQAMHSGLYWGYVSMINGILEKITSESQLNNPNIIGTGGLSSLFDKDIDLISHIDETLTLTGLKIIHKRMQTSKVA